MLKSTTGNAGFYGAGIACKTDDYMNELSGRKRETTNILKEEPQSPFVATHMLGSNTIYFPQRLFMMLDEIQKIPAKQHFSVIVSWDPSGTSFSIHKPNEFVSKVMPIYFRTQSKLVSFKRQLNNYGFQRAKEAKQSDSQTFYHKEFVRNNLRMCRNIQLKAKHGMVPTKTCEGVPLTEDTRRLTHLPLYNKTVAGGFPSSPFLPSTQQGDDFLQPFHTDFTPNHVFSDSTPKDKVLHQYQDRCRKSSSVLMDLEDYDLKTRDGKDRCRKSSSVLMDLEVDLKTRDGKEQADHHPSIDENCTDEEMSFDPVSDIDWDPEIESLDGLYLEDM